MSAQEKKSAIGGGDALVVDEIQANNVSGVFLQGVVYVGFAADPALGVGHQPFIVFPWNSGSGVGIAALDNLGAPSDGLQLKSSGGLPSWSVGDSKYATTLSGSVVTYAGKSVVPSHGENLNFTAGTGSGGNKVTRHEISVTGLTCTLDSADATDTTYEFWDMTGNVNPNFTLAPNGGKLINGAASLTVTTQYFGRSVRRNSDGNWTMAQ